MKVSPNLRARLGVARADTPWNVITQEKVEGGFYLLVTRATNPVRWRWSVSEIEYQTVPHDTRLLLKADGYMKSLARAVRAADAARVALGQARPRKEDPR